MACTQTIEVRSSDEQALHAHVSAWHAEQAGVAPGYQRARSFDTAGHLGLIYADTALFVVGAILAWTALQAPRR